MSRSLIAIGLILIFGWHDRLIAGERIVGAFGLQLGQKSDAESLKTRTQKRPGSKFIRFEPANPVRYFNEYVFGETPISKRISTIIAMSPYYESLEKCKEDNRGLLLVLERKYGASTKAKTVSVGVWNNRYIFRGRRYIHTGCQIEMGKGYILYVQYADGHLNDIREKEQAKMDANSVNSKGL